MTIERPHGYGAKKINPVRRFLHKKLQRGTLGRATVFDWTAGYDVRTKIGAIKIKNQGVNSSCGRQAGSQFQYISAKLRGKDEGEVCVVTERRIEFGYSRRLFTK